MRRFSSFRERARWVALLALALPVGGVLLAVVVPRIVRALGRLSAGW